MHRTEESVICIFLRQDYKLTSVFLYKISKADNFGVDALLLSAETARDGGDFLVCSLAAAGMKMNRPPWNKF